MKSLFILFLFFIVSLNAKEKVVLQLNWFHQFQFAGYYVAKEMGYYDNLGLDVEIKEFTRGLNLVDEIDLKKSDFAIGRSDLLIDKFEKKDVVAIAAIFQDSPFILLTKKDSGINSIEELRNKNIMMSEDMESLVPILAMLSSKGITLNDFFQQKHTYKLEDLINRKTDAMAAYISNEPNTLRDLGIEYNIFHPKDYGFKFYSDILFTSSAFINRNQKLTKDFFEATIRGWEYAFKNIAITSELIYKNYNTQNKSLINIIKEGEALKKLSFDENGNIGLIDKKVLSDITKIYNVFGLINGEIDYDEFIYKGNHPKTYSIEFTQTHLFHFTIIAILIILLSASLLLYFLLKKDLFITKNKLEKKVLEQKNDLLIQNKKLNDILNSSSEIIAYKDKNSCYLGVNERFCVFVNKRRKKIIGKKDKDIFELDETVNFIQKIENEVLTLNRKLDSINWIKIPNKKEKKLIKSTVLPYEYEKGEIGVLIFLSDITELKKLENERVANQRILLTQSKIAAIGEMLGNIAHQWRQPLAVMTMNLNNVKLDLELEGNVKNEDLKKFIKSSSKQIDYLSNTIEDFRNFFKADSENKTIFNLKEVLEKLEGLIKGSLSHNFIEYIVNVEDEIVLNANESVMLQSFINICNNAKDAFSGSEVNDNDRFIFIDVKKVDDMLSIKFKDSAGGIKEEIIDKIFEPYFTTKHQSVGTGIGLYMTHQIITKHLEGSIVVENKEFKYNNKKLKGAEFTITIPI